MRKSAIAHNADRALEALEDYGCLHFKTPIICGVSEPRYSPEELKHLNEQNARTFEINGKEMTGYEASQAMRKLETEVRKQKTIRETARASGDKEQVRRCNARIKACKAKYAEISDITGISQEPKRMSIPRMPKTSGNPLTTTGNGGIIEMSRKTSNTGAFSVLPERMSKKNIRSLAKECNIDLKRITLDIDLDEEKLKLPYTGRADYQTIGKITFFQMLFEAKKSWYAPCFTKYNTLDSSSATA